MPNNQSKKENLKAIRECVQHWMLDIRRPLLGGDKIVGEVFEERWHDTHKKVKLGGDHCALCKLHGCCGRCPLFLLTIRTCDQANAPYTIFVDHPTLSNANDMVCTLVRAYWAVMEG